AQAYDDAVDPHAIDGDAHTGTLSTSNVTEGTNLYYTEARVSANSDVASNTSHSASSSNPHTVTKTQVSLGNVTDDAQLKRAAADFSSFSSKASPVSGDVLLIEDSQDSSNKKYITVGDIPGDNPPSSIEESTTTTTTTSTTDTQVNSMSVTPAAGTYLVFFTGDVSASVDAQQISLSIYSAGSQVTSSERVCGFNSYSDSVIPFTCVARVTVNGSQAIQGYWRTSAGTATMTQRSLAIVEVT
ncbi:MAG: hypothetical protein MJA29_04025, partial [Candidatus Omnitrophica bacterium]|nr:hypothetical protein [Candidatus Omnitrophota bacterium]